MNEIKVIGLDVVFRTSGIAVVNSTSSILLSSTISVHKKLHGALALGNLRERLDEIVGVHKPQLAVIEDYSLGSLHDIRRLAEASGVAKACCGVYKVPCIAVPPTQIKLAVADHGHSSKEEVAKAVSKLFNITIEAGDKSDALAAAYVGLLLLGFRKPFRRGEYDVLSKLAPELKKLAI